VQIADANYHEFISHLGGTHLRMEPIAISIYRKPPKTHPLISLVEGLLANEPTYLDSQRRKFGSNFCCAGQVLLGDLATVETALTSPQGRTWRLGTTILDAHHSPNQDVGGRNVFLLSLSDESAGSSTDHAAFRKCMQDYLINDSASTRQQDPIARKLLDKLVPH
jgi:hypothetical protein